MIEIVRFLWGLVGIYLMLGGLFSIAFHCRGLCVVDPATSGAGVFFRLLITPGLMALWPWMAMRWWDVARGVPRPGDADVIFTPVRLRTLHANAWKVLAVLGPLILGVALWFRPAQTFLAPAELPTHIAPETVP